MVHTVARYLALDAILPGDVILSAGATAASHGIRAATLARVSHAALAIHPLIWFEALGNRGIDYQIVDPQFVWDGRQVRLGRRIHRGETYIVRRPAEGLCSAEDPVARHGFARSLIHASSKFAFLNYARPEQFLPMLKFRLGSLGVAEFIANNLNRSRTALFPGPFCSWLVADCYREIGHPLFEAASNKITPGALDRSSRLRKVRCEIIARPVDLPPRLRPFEKELQLVVRQASDDLWGLRQGAHLAKLTEEINARFVHFAKGGAKTLGAKTLGAKTLGANALQADIEALGQISEENRRAFESWQNRTRIILGDAYARLAASTEQAGFLTACYQECLDKPPGGSSCPDHSGCYRITKGWLATAEHLTRVFPGVAPPPH